jgi:hypothetical protein
LKQGYAVFGPESFLRSFPDFYATNHPGVVQFNHWKDMVSEPWDLASFVAKNGDVAVRVSFDTMGFTRRVEAKAHTTVAEFTHDPSYKVISPNGERSSVFDYDALQGTSLARSLTFMETLVPGLLDGVLAVKATSRDSLEKNPDQKPSELVLSIAHGRAGTMFHSHAEAFFFLGEGEKLWFLLPPAATRVPGIPALCAPETVTTSTAQFIAKYYGDSGVPEGAEISGPTAAMAADFPGMVVVLQKASTMLLVPRGWFHATWTPGEGTSLGASVHPLEGFCYAWETRPQCDERWEDPKKRFDPHDLDPEGQCRSGSGGEEGGEDGDHDEEEREDERDEEDEEQG